MSFSFNVLAKSKAEALEAVRAKMDEVVAAQDAHKHDAMEVIAVTETYLDLIEMKEGVDNVVSVSLSGSVGWENRDPSKPNTDPAERRFTGAGLNVSVRCYREA